MEYYDTLAMLDMGHWLSNYITDPIHFEHLSLNYLLDVSRNMTVIESLNARQLVIWLFCSFL